ncbi:uncharacterized protein LOC132708568 [Cylas formicarius]|uniref:uncharacterized protein LOC132708568 n=1 Tax=Cylas formicarius TaxID=197179 RepID=UPI00295894FA|nr:uncharacterized protein LOC132708568 [Cylas formicarius]
MTAPVVAIKHGKLLGAVKKNFDGDNYYRFLGIPYAKPPIGELRFKAPQPIDPWDDVRDATKDGNVCYQINQYSGQIATPANGSEDCLYLNVATRELPGPGITPKPVLVHIHGGAFTIGSGNQEGPIAESPEMIMTQDVVFVGFNYRLGILGFLSMEDPSLEVPGNAGLKDQVLALKWIQENIAAFNGDPKNVTIFGISAGGAAVQFQLLSPLSRGLFHRAITQSGSVLSPWAWGSKNAILAAEKLGESVKTEKEALEILRRVPVEELFEAQSKLEDNIEDSRYRRPFSPVIETPSPEAFLDKHPVELLKAGEFNRVPLIIGCTTEESLTVITVRKGKSSIEQGIPWYFDLKSDSEEYEKVRKEFIDFYGHRDAVDGFVFKLYSDAMFVGAVTEFARLTAKASQNPVFFYQFAASSVLENLDEALRSKQDFAKGKGAFHGIDGLYIFGKKPPLIKSPNDVKIMRNVLKMWTNFAKDGRPTIKDQPTNWDPVTDPENLSCLIIDEELKFQSNPFADSTDFWKKLYTKYDLKLLLDLPKNPPPLSGLGTGSDNCELLTPPTAAPGRVAKFGMQNYKLWIPGRRKDLLDDHLNVGEIVGSQPRKSCLDEEETGTKQAIRILKEEEEEEGNSLPFEKLYYMKTDITENNQGYDENLSSPILNATGIYNKLSNFVVFEPVSRDKMTEPIVTVKQGILRGKIAKDFDGNNYYKFLGIPFAKPPIGNLRFKAPEPAGPWEDVRDATTDGNICYQMNILTKTVSGSEDCLYLNVATKHLPSEEISPRPVMVHLHGGGFVSGTGNQDQEMFGSADYLLTEDVVFVGVNYRLGILGFLSLEDESLDVPGNAGLKDQVLGLKWVQENIAFFNGDPNNVTIFGVSAGGASVQFQILSPLSKGLFHKAISQSGGILNPWAWGCRNNAIDAAKKLNQGVKFEADALEVLQNISIEELYKTQLQFKDDLLEMRARRPFSPVIEKSSPTAFLSKHPLEVLKSGEFNQVPMIVGCTSEEGWRFDTFKQSQSCIEQGIPWYFHLKPGTEEYERVNKSFKAFYDGYESRDGFIYKLYSDAMFVAGITEFIKLAVQKSANPIFFYQFAVDRELADCLGILLNLKYEPGKGASHAADCAYMFMLVGHPVSDPTDIKIMRNLVKMWTNFAKYGAPTLDSSLVDWQPVKSPNELPCLKIDENLSLVQNPFQKSVELWQELFSNYYPKLY